MSVLEPEKGGYLPALPVPEGHPENSPAFQRREPGITRQSSPEGTVESVPTPPDSVSNSVGGVQAPTQSIKSKPMKRHVKTTTTIRLTPWLASLAVLAALTGSGSVHSQTWQTVLDYQFISGLESGGFSIAAGTLGNVFTGGFGYYAAGNSYDGLVLKVDTTGATWGLSDDTDLSRSLYGSSVVRTVGMDSKGNVYSVGPLNPRCSKNSCPGSDWLVRKSSDGGATWSTVDLFQYPSGKGAYPWGLGADGSGHIFVAGNATDKGGFDHWIVRASANAGQSWTMVDDVKGGYPRGVYFAPGIGLFVVGGQNSSLIWSVRRSLDGGATWSTVDAPFAGRASGACSDSQGNVYVVGVASGQWVVRRSTDGGNTWLSVDQIANAIGEGIGRDSAGNPVAVGEANDAQGVSHWSVRRPDSSGVWQTIDDYQLAPGYGSGAFGVVTDVAGNLLVVGGASDAANTGHWIVRRLPSAAP
jgi:hypothetical protein